MGLGRVRQELIPAHITYRSELNEAEQENIVRAEAWAFARRRDVLSEKFVKDLHKRMLGDVWRWAGRFRTSEKNLGIPFYEIPASIHQLLDDTKAWIQHEDPPDESVVRFSHRLVQIHPFPNGNGRHSRLIADLLVMSLGGERFSWGSANLQDAGTVRGRGHSSVVCLDAGVRVPTSSVVSFPVAVGLGFWSNSS